MDRLERAIRPIAAAMNMTFDVQGSHAHVRENVIRLEKDGIILEPAPLTPDSGATFDLVGGTIRHVFPGAIVVPSAMTAFTDTQCESRRPLGGADDRLLGPVTEHLPLRAGVDDADAQLPYCRRTDPH